MRRCIACVNSFPQKELIRMVRCGDGIQVDIAGTLEGRGFYICRNKECIEKAFRKSLFNRSCRFKFNEEALKMLRNELIDLTEEETNVKESQ